MANKGVIAAFAGVGAGSVMTAAYFGAPYAGYHISAMTMTLAAAVAAFGASISLLTLSALTRVEKKKPASTTRLRDLDFKAFEHFPTGGVRIVVKPDTAVTDFGVVRHPKDYEGRDVFVTIKKASGKSVFNPIVLKQLFEALKNFENFIHILLINEYEEYIGYVPAAYARAYMIGDNAETQIARYITDVLADPGYSIVLREIGGFSMKKCIGLSVRDCIPDDALVSEALKKMTDLHLRGLVVFKDQRNRKPVGVIYDEDLVRLMLKGEI
jgi:hypothetical protein